MNKQDRHIQAQILRMILAMASGDYNQAKIIEECEKYLVQVIGQDGVGEI